MFNRIIVALMQVSSEISYVESIRKDGKIFYVKMKNRQDKVSANEWFLNSMRVILFATCLSVVLWFKPWLVLLTVVIFLIGWGFSAVIRYWVYMDCESGNTEDGILRHLPHTIGYYMVKGYGGFEPVFIQKRGRNLRFEIVSEYRVYGSEEEFLEHTKNKPKSNNVRLSTESIEIKPFPTEADASEQQ